MKRYRTNRELTIMYRGRGPALPGWDGVPVCIPVGHPVARREMGTPPGYIYYADQPSKLLDRKTQGHLLHDATYYGILIPYDAVEEC